MIAQAAIVMMLFPLCKLCEIYSFRLKHVAKVVNTSLFKCRDLNVDGGRHVRGVGGNNEVDAMSANPPPSPVSVDQLVQKLEVRIILITLFVTHIHIHSSTTRLIVDHSSCR